MNGDTLQLVVGTLQGIVSSTAFVLFLFIGFCVVVGFTKTKKNRQAAGRWSSRASTSGSAIGLSSISRRARRAARPTSSNRRNLLRSGRS